MNTSRLSPSAPVMLTTATTEWTSAVEEGLTLCHWNTYKLTISHSHTLALRPSLNRARVWPVTFPQLTPHPKHSVWLPLGICKHLTTFSISSSYYSLHTWPISSRNPQCVITFNKLIMQEWVTIIQHLKDFLCHSVMHFSVSVSNWTCTYNSPTHCGVGGKYHPLLSLFWTMFTSRTPP